MRDCSIQIATVLQVKSLLRVRPNVTFMVETDLTMVRWPIPEDERSVFKSPIAPDGFKWLIIEHGSEKPVYKILNSI